MQNRLTVRAPTVRWETKQIQTIQVRFTGTNLAWQSGRLLGSLFSHYRNRYLATKKSVPYAEQPSAFPSPAAPGGWWDTSQAVWGRLSSAGSHTGHKTHRTPDQTQCWGTGCHNLCAKMISITFSIRKLQLVWQHVKKLTYSGDNCACEEEGAAEIPVTGICWVAWGIHSIFPGIQNHLQAYIKLVI